MNSKPFQSSWSRLRRALSRTGRPSVSPEEARSKSSDPDIPPPVNPDPPNKITFDKPPADHNHNDNLIINRLPPELLAAIFVLVCEGSKLGDYSWVACSHICSSWRRLALDTAPLWSHIVFTSSEWMRLCLERSKSSLLVIETDLTIHSDEALICEALALADRIGIIKIRFSHLGDPLLKLLPGPFPVLSALTLENTGVQPGILFEPNMQPYPDLRELCIYTSAPIPLPLSAPSCLVFLEIHNYATDVVEWSTFTDFMRSLGDLEALSLQGFPLPPSDLVVRTHMISLPNLRDIVLNGLAAHCRSFIRAVDSPWLRRYRIYPSDTEGVGELFQTVLGTLPGPPKSLILRRTWNHHDHPSDYYHPAVAALPQHAGSVFSQTAHIGFSYLDVRDLNAASVDVSFSWVTESLLDSDLAKIFAALSDVPCIDTIQWLSANHWNVTPQGSWKVLLRRLVGLQTLVIAGHPASGLVWDLVKQFESPTGGQLQVEPSTQFCPELRRIEVIGVDCCAGSWIPPLRTPREATVITNSYLDEDNARFLEVLVCYLELRAPTGKLATLKLSSCSNYSVTEVKLLRLLVTQVVWDGTGMVEATYSPNGDEFSARTIKHHLLDRRPSYEEVNLTEDERRKQENWTWWSIRPSSRSSDRLYTYDI
ncbi:hypothetical protein C8R46DRAFT_1078337 [Mycena filopes]|nr:hypothetical protein C8R46DRAFT_1078337 [Mycena filopes]